jgi:hypothetical protein
MHDLVPMMQQHLIRDGAAIPAVLARIRMIVDAEANQTRRQFPKIAIE